MERERIIKEYMFEHDLNNGDIAEKLKCSKAYVTKILQNKVSLSERMEYKLNRLLKEIDSTNMQSYKK